MQELKVGERVAIEKGGIWCPAVVVAKTQTSRSYIVRTPDGQSYRRNRRHIIKYPATVLEQTYPDNDFQYCEAETQADVCDNNSERVCGNTSNSEPLSPAANPDTPPTETEAPQPRRSHRTIKKPVRYSDQWITINSPLTQ